MRKKTWLVLLVLLSIARYGFTAEFSEEQRKAIYEDYYSKFNTVLPESRRQYPTDAQSVRGWTGDEIMEQVKRQYKFQNERFAQYEKETFLKYGITEEEFKAIRSEGYNKDW